MADANVALTPGSGVLIDTRTEPGGDHRQVVVLGDPATAATALVDGSGRLTVNTISTQTAAPAATSVRTNVTASTTEGQLLAQNLGRYAASILNDSTTAKLYLGLGGTAVSATSHTIVLPPGGFYEVPAGVGASVRGIWDIASGTARVTETS